MKSLLAVGIASSALIVSGCSNSVPANIHMDRHDRNHSGSGQYRYDQDGDVSHIGSDMEVSGRIGGDLSLIGSDLDVNADIGGDMSLVGSDIDFDGSVSGEANIAGSDIHWTGRAQRDIDIAGSDVNWSGMTEDSLSIAGSDVVIDGRVGQNLDVAGSDIHVSADSEIGGNVSIAGSDIEIDGQISGNTELTGNRIDLDGEIEGRMLARAYSTRGWAWTGRDARYHTVHLNGSIGEGSAICARYVVISDTASIAGNLMIFADEPPTFESRLSPQNVTFDAIAGRDCDDLLDTYDN
ncbi:MAG: hypothetical protein DHS20C06_12640 [Hyphobacterium sp.]|nr:MAG: hypothetical protein DHS20C06_12640 [Hyphobacterium sp.]